MTIRLRILLLGVIAVGSLIFLLAASYVDQLDYYRHHQRVAANVDDVRALSTLVHELQKERGTSTGFLAAPTGDNAAAMAEQRERSGRAFRSLPDPEQEVRAVMAEIATLRDEVSARAIDAAEAKALYSRRIDGLLDRLWRLARVAVAPKVKDQLVALAHLAYAKEHLGQIRALLNSALNQGAIDDATSREAARLDAVVRDRLRQFRRDASPAALAAYDHTVVGQAAAQTYAAIAQAAGPDHGGMTLDAKAWFASSTATMDLIKEVEDAIATAVNADLRTMTDDVRRDLLLHSLGITALALLVLGLAVSTIRGMLRALDKLLSGVERIIETKDFTTRIPLRSSRDEIGTISRGFNELLEIADGLLREKDYLAATDALTGIANRLRFNQIIAGELARKRRHPGAASLILFDIDHFKRINDAYGHGVGDEVLKGIAQLVSAAIRETDLLARWGGEEFVLLLPDDAPPAAAVLAEKLRHAIAVKKFATVGQVTASFGLAGLGADDTADTWCKRADDALYRAKREGRNRVVVAQAVEV